MRVLQVTGLGDLAGVHAIVDVEWSQWLGVTGRPPHERSGTWVRLSTELNESKLGAKAFVPDEPREGDPTRSIDEAREALRANVGGRLLKAFGV